MLHLAFVNQFLHRTSYIFDRHFGINTVLIEQINNVRPESFQRSFSNFLDVLWTAVHTDGPTTLRIEFKSKLRGDHHLLAKRSEAFAHEFLVRERAINFGGIEKCDAAFHSRAKQRDHLVLIFGRAIAETHPHAAQSDCRYFQSAFAEFALFHSVTSKNVLGRDHHLDGFAIIHRPVTVGNIVKTHGPIEHAAGLDVPLKNIRQKVFDISTHWSRPATDRDI